jgi:hypothetical protein
VPIRFQGSPEHVERGWCLLDALEAGKALDGCLDPVGCGLLLLGPADPAVFVADVELDQPGDPRAPRRPRRRLRASLHLSDQFADERAETVRSVCLIAEISGERRALVCLSPIGFGSTLVGIERQPVLPLRCTSHNPGGSRNPFPGRGGYQATIGAAHRRCTKQSQNVPSLVVTVR